MGGSRRRASPSAPAPGPKSSKELTNKELLAHVAELEHQLACLGEQARDEKHRTSDQLRAVLDSVSDGVLVVDAKDEIVFANPAVQDLMGWHESPQGMVDSYFSELEVTDHAGRAAAREDWPLARALRGETVKEVELRVRRRDAGTSYIGLFSATPVFDRDGKVILAVVTTRDITERERAEHALRVANQRFESVLGNLDDDFAIVDSGWCCVYVNDAVVRHLGRPRDQLLGKSFLEVLPQIAVAPTLGHFEAVAKERQLRQWTERSRATGRWLEWRAFPWEAGVACITRDITERRRAEEAQKQSEQRLRALVDNVNAGVALIDEAGRFSLYNSQFLRMFGLAADADVRNVNDQDWGLWKVFDEQGNLLPVDEHPVRKAVLTHRAVRERLVGVQLPQGEDITWMLISAEPLFDLNGKLESIVCTYTDLTEGRRSASALRESEEALRRSQAEMQTLLENAPAGLALFEGKRPYKVLAHNRYYQELFAEPFRSRGMVGFNVFAYAPAVEAEGVVAVFDEVVRGRAPKSFLDFPYKSDPPKQSWFNWHIAPLILDGEVVALVSMSLDVTQRHLAEEELREANERLVEADRRKSEFLAVLSHELRNPLAPIVNSLYILEHAPAGGEQAERAKQVISRQVAQLSNLVNDLLDVTRISRGMIQLQKERLELCEVVRRAVEDNRSLFERARVHLELAPAPRPVPVIADCTRVAQIVGNLLQNSAKFTGNGGLTQISVAAEGNQAIVRVVDNGVGMSRETLERLFQPFMQAEQSLDRSQGGLGLGLALVKGLVELHGGSVSARREGLGHGAELVVRLPLYIQ